jgi:hypothetical protein
MKTCFSKIGIATLLAMSTLVGCGAKEKNPVGDYKQPGVLPHDQPTKPEPAVARNQQKDECGFGFQPDKAFEVSEGETFTQKITVTGRKSFAGGLALQNAPKGMSIDGFTITYNVPRGIVKSGEKATFTYTVLPASQNGRIQCAADFTGTVTLHKRPVVSISDVPTEINIDTVPAKFSAIITVNADVKSSDSITLSAGFDKLLTSKERKVYDLTEAASLAKTSTATGNQQRIFAFEIDPAKMASMIAATPNPKKKSEFIFLAVMTAKNEENKTTYSKNLTILVKRTPVEEPKAPAKKAGQ